MINKIFSIRRVLSYAVAFLLAPAIFAYNGEKLWFQGEADAHASVSVAKSSPTLQIASRELRQGWHGVPVEILVESAGEISDEGFKIIPSDEKIVITSPSDRGALYGAFHLLRQQSIAERKGETLNLKETTEQPAYMLRILDHWDNPNRTIERGYAGRSIWEWDKLPAVVSPRYKEYARANASLGINGAVLNNVSATPEVLTTDFLKKVKVVADILRPYGIRVYLSVNFASPMKIGKLSTADPLDKNVAKWWNKKVKEIYKLIPDFGGFLVKANSEGQPGPCDYGRSHAEGANMLADALSPYGGIVMWRAFVYNPTGSDRAAQAHDEFKPLDGQFRPNVIIQVKNGPIDFQPREPYSPLFTSMEHTDVMAELQITQEYLGHANHLVYLAPMWEEFFRYVKPGNLKGIAGASNIGDNANWCGHPFGQANWYAFGRMAWDPTLKPGEIADEWLWQTLYEDSGVTDEKNAAHSAIKWMMTESREAAVNYMTPLGLNHLIAWGHHYGPQPWCHADWMRPDWLPAYYHKADTKGLGFDRSASGSNAAAQYPDTLAQEFGNIDTCPEQFLLWFHHVPWSHTMKSGDTMWNELCRHYDRGVRQVREFKHIWQDSKPFVNQDLHANVAKLLETQEKDAVWWKDACLLYFQTFSGLPIPSDIEPTVYTLDELKKINIPISNYESPSPELLDLHRRPAGHAPKAAVNSRPLDYVDVKIGSGDHGHVFVGASVPFGMVQLGPTSIPETWDWCSGYHDSDSTVIGFSHTHLEGTGIGDLFDVTIMPVTGKVTYARGTEDDPASGLWSYGDRSQEIARPGYYSVPLTRYGILAEMTATNRVGLHRYTFPTSEEAAIVIDLQNGGCWDKPTETYMTAENDSTISGYRYSSGWAKDQKVYFVARFSRPFESFEKAGEGEMYGRANFKTADRDKIMLKVGISPVSIEGARANLEAEMPGWNFEEIVADAESKWNGELEKITVSSANEADLKKFYTAMYHTMIAPATFNDVTGEYRGADGKIYKNNEMTPYTILSLWDTYRALMPLYSIIHRDRNADIINGMTDICDKQGRLPVWHLWGNETDCMVGNPGVIAVCDAIVKQEPGVDIKSAYEAVLKTADNPGRGAGLRFKYGFIPCDKMNEAIAYDMEYAIADAAVANAARAMGDSVNMVKYAERSRSYRNYFDPQTGFMRGKMSDGSIRTPFDPNSSSYQKDDYCEGNAWQYTWLVPHDIEGLVDCFGSKEKTLEKLDLLFNTDSELRGVGIVPDISGLIGQYAHGNEPSHHIIYFYNMLGEPDKGADLLRRVYDEFYTIRPDGLAGNEDAGQMSAWYIFSTLGFYPVEPAGARYWFGAPLFDKAVIKVPGREFIVRTENLSADTPYIRNVTLNGKPYDLPYIMHDDIIKGGELVFVMGK